MTLSVLLAVALAVRLLAWHRTVMMMNDGPNFLWQAQALAAGHWHDALGHHFPPGYAAATALALPFFDDPLLAALVVSIAAGLLLVIAAWGLARSTFPDTPAAAPAAALVAALNVRCVAYTSDIQADGLFAALLACAAWALLRATAGRGQRGLAALAGLILGLGYLVRMETLFLLLPLGLWCLAGLRSATPGFRRRLGLSAIVLGTTALGVLPYVVALHQVTGRWALSNKPSAQHAGLGGDGPVAPAPDSSPLHWPRVTHRPGPPVLPGPDDAGESRRAAGAAPAARPVTPPDRGALLLPFALPFLDEEPAAATPGDETQASRWIDALHVSLVKFVHALRLEYVLLIVPGLVVLWRRRRGLCALLLFSLLVWLAITTVQVRLSGFLSTRHMMIPVTLLLPIAGAGLVTLWRKGWFWRVLVVLALLEPVEVANRDYHSNHRPRLAALAWIEEHSAKDQLFATHRQRDGWYAHRVPLLVDMPVDTAAMAASLRAYDVPWMAFDLDKLREYQPEWLEQDLIIEQLRFGEGDETVVVYAPAFGEAR